MRRRLRRPGRPTQGGFALLEVLAFAAILALAVTVLQRTLLAAEASLMQARVEATVGRALRYHANLLLNCPYDLLPAEGETLLESGHAFRPWQAGSGTFEERLPYEVYVLRGLADAGTDAERSELRLRVSYQVPADASATSNALPERPRQREHPAIFRRPGGSL